MKKILSIFCFSLLLTSLMSQVTLVKDIRVDSASSEVNGLLRADGFAYFKYKNLSGLYNILKTNGSVQEKLLPYDVPAITECEYGEGVVYYTDGAHLWATDGTPFGLREVYIYGTPPTDITSLTYSGGTLWFRGDSGGDVELYWCDSYYAGEIEVNPTDSSSPTSLTDFNGTLYFVANDGASGHELFRAEHLSPYDYAVTLVKNINPSDNSSFPKWLCVWNNILYFSADDGGNGRELWKSNGTAAGTVMVADIFPGEEGSEPTALTGLGGSIVLFTAFDGTSGFELWKTNGTAAGTTLVKDIYPGDIDSYPSRFTLVGGTVYFTAFEPNTGNELWKTNGTAAGTVLVKDIELGPVSSSPKNFTAGTTHLYFSATTAATGREFFSSTGTAATTKMMADIGPGNSDGTSKADVWLALGNTLYFPARNPAIGRELWKSNGTSTGTVLFLDCANSDSNPVHFTRSGNVLFFSATKDTLGSELWKTNGTEAGTVLVKEIYPGHGSADPQNLTDLNGLLIFSARSAHGAEIWASDGTAAGTIELKDIGDGWGGSKPRNLKKIGNAVYFAASNSAAGVELYKTDGTPAGTVLVKDINLGQESSNPSELYDIGGGTALFMATTATHGRELWKTDGTAAGTVMVRDIAPFNGIRYTYSDGAVLNGVFYFKATDGLLGEELWRSDGTESGTYMVKDIHTGAPFSAPFSFMTLGNSVCFVAFTPAKGNEVWKTDGTAVGTVMLKDISVGSSGSIGQNPELFQNSFTLVNGNLYFGAKTLGTGNELWKTDGTPAGTVLVKEICPGTQGSGPFVIGTTPTLFLFGAYHPLYGEELWQSDGTAGGTFLVQDIYGGDVGSVFSKGAVLGDKLIFGGQNNFNGFEVLAYTLPVQPPTVLAADRTDETASQDVAGTRDQKLFKIYPNPAGKTASLEFFETTPGETQVAVMDMTGKTVWQQTVSEAGEVKIDVSDLPAGVYLVRASNKGGQESRKLVVQKQ